MAQKKSKPVKRTPAYSTDSMAVRLIFGLLFIALGVMIFLSVALRMTGDVFDGLRQFSCGLCGLAAYILPAVPIWGGILLMISPLSLPISSTNRSAQLVSSSSSSPIQSAMHWNKT